MQKYFTTKYSIHHSGDVRVLLLGTFLGNKKVLCVCFFFKACFKVTHILEENQSTGQGNGLKMSEYFHNYLIFVLELRLSSDDLRSIWFGCIRAILVDFHL